MILAHLNDDHPLPAIIEKAIQHLRQTDYRDRPSGRYEITNDMFALVQDPMTQEWASGSPEFHRRHIDVQCLLQGEEVMGFAPAESSKHITQNFLEERDIAFVEPVENETKLVLSPGMYAVFYPGELHRPCRYLNAPMHIKKVVIKIAIA